MRTAFLLVLLLVYPSIAFAAPLPVGMFGFEFGMSISEAIDVANDAGYVVNREDLPKWMDPEPKGFYSYNVLPSFPSIYKNDKAVTAFGGYTTLSCDMATDATRYVFLIFGDNKLFEICRSLKMPTATTPLSLEKDIVAKYGKPNKAKFDQRTSAVNSREYGRLWNNDSVAMEVVYTSTDAFGNGNYTWDDRFEINYISLDIAKYLSGKINDLKKQLENEESGNFQPKL